MAVDVLSGDDVDRGIELADGEHADSRKPDMRPVPLVVALDLAPGDLDPERVLH